MNNNIDNDEIQYHAEWELDAVISGHLGWVRSIAFDPTNEKVLRGIPEIVELERILRSMGYISVGFEPNVQVPRGGFGAEITMVRAMC